MFLALNVVHVLVPVHPRHDQYSVRSGDIRARYLVIEPQRKTRKAMAHPFLTILNFAVAPHGDSFCTNSTHIELAKQLSDRAIAL
jgi:hypothetical protein